jgi:hypothetical protein
MMYFILLFSFLLHSYLCLNFTSHNRSLNTAFVLVLENSEEATLTPRRVPGVDDSPVLYTILLAKANDFDSVSTVRLASDVLVDTRFVGQEIVVDSEGSTYTSLFHQFLLDVGHTLHRVRRLSEVLVLRVRSGVEIGGTRRSAGRSGVIGEIITALEIGVVHVVSTGREGVRLARRSRIGRFVQTTSRNSLVLEESEGTRRLTTVAAHAESTAQATAASQGVGGGEKSAIPGLNADSIVQHFGRRESPARAARTLISSCADQISALRPLLSSIERRGRRELREGLGGKSHVVLFTREHCAHHVLDLRVSHVGESSVSRSLPERLDRVDNVNNFLSDIRGGLAKDKTNEKEESQSKESHV